MLALAQSDKKALPLGFAVRACTYTMENLPSSFTVNNDSYHKRESAVITFTAITDTGARAAVYKREKDNVQQYGYNSLTTAHKWAVKYYVEPTRRANQFFKTRKAAIEFANRINNK